uniref:Uncharacterized protein LOC114330143 n=1 Tax=Diabrotica virgifera virgifera TaxID=50390 RepID=A0A6P7FQT1_DIAVI
MGPPSATNIVLLACGSYNPPTNMHLRMFELARDYLHRMGQHVVLGGVISPVHDGYGKEDLAHSNHRLEMVKLALQNHDWVSYSNWECSQESWTRTREVLQYHQVIYFIKTRLLSWKNSKYLHVPNSVFLTPSPTDIIMDSPSPKNCMSICDNNLFSRQQYGTRLSIDTVDTFVKTGMKHPGQAVKVVKDKLKVHTIVHNQPEQKASLVRPACL